MKSFFALTIASSYGLLIRGIFGFISPNFEIMSLTFLCLVPFIIGFLTVRFWPEGKIKSNWSAFAKPWLTCLILLIVSMLLKIEGAICWIMIYPFFSFAAGLGGILTFKIMNKRSSSSNNPDILDENDWDNSSTLKMSLVLLLPVFMGFIEGDHSSSRQYITLEESVTINASTDEIWQTITHIDQVDQGEKGTYLTNALGFPKHLYTTLDTCLLGNKRMCYYEKGLVFEETITEVVPHKKLVLDIYVDPTKIPATVLDEHIVIGGKHVDVLKDTYLLEPQTDGATHLSLTSQYSINTPFNWYAGIWAKYLMSDLLKGELNLIKQRSEL
ncbi:hypothetical protein [Lewinella cohaerens]|uniref:hypothetical protein n=1 Tax=Lewinella cohaerens TaxID=70995 RepID=UPI00039D4522|nr:hypothetical protein [Lewinella cohaerens]